MKKLISAICFCLFLTFLGLMIFIPKSEAEVNVLQNLIDLPAPPPNPITIKNSKGRGRNYLTEKPDDDAPIEDLLNYWERYGRTRDISGYFPKPSDKTLDRLMEEFEKDPERLPNYLSLFPSESKYSDSIKNLYEKELTNRKSNKYWRSAIKSWLTANTDNFSDELLGQAQQVKDTGEYLTNHRDLIALAKVNWEKARPIVERLLNDRSQPISQTLARWVAYQHATDEGNSIDAEKYRKALQETVEDKNNKPGNRDLAMDAIVKVGDFSGRDDWYFSLLEDESLHDLRVNGNSYTGLTTLILASPPEKYAAKMIELAAGNNQIIRNAAVKNLALLINNGNPEVIKALLPWLENPTWAKEERGERQNLVSALQRVELPESVPGLIAVLNEKVTRKLSYYGANIANQAVNSASSAANRTINEAEVEAYPLRYSAILALTAQKDMRAITALRILLPESDQGSRTLIIKALLECKGFSVSEQVQGLEVVAKDANKYEESVANTPEKETDLIDTSANSSTKRSAITTSLRSTYYGANVAYNAVPQPFNPEDVPKIIGYFLISNREVSEELVTATIERVKVLEKKSPKIAVILRSYVKNWHGKGVNSLMLSDLKSGAGDIDSVIKLLTIRKELREKQNNEVYDIRGGNAFALGISACILEDNNEYDSILNGENIEAKTAMLGCAKLLRATLPINKVAENLKSPNKLLALAAERFLESEDSPQSRQIVLSLHPNEAKILGAKTAFFFTENSNDFVGSENLYKLFSGTTVESNEEYLSRLYLSNQYFATPPYLVETEKRLQKEVKENAELSGIYSYDGNFVRIYKDKAVFSWEEDAARYRERTLTKEEFGNLTSYLSFNHVDEIMPFNSDCGYCQGKELLMLGKQGGRRVFVKDLTMPKFFAELDQIFDDLRKPSAKLHYWLEKYIGGLEVLFEDEKFLAKTVWKNGNEVKLLIEEANKREKILNELSDQLEAEEEKILANYNEQVYEKWIIEREKRQKQRENEEFSWYKLENNKLASIIEQPAEVEFLAKKDNAIEAGDEQWKARTANVEIRTDGTALYKIAKGITTKIKTGNYKHLVVTANGNWLIATKTIEYEQTLVKINLLTGKEFKLQSPEEVPSINAEVFVSTINKVLVFVGSSYRQEDEEYDEEYDNSRNSKQFKEGNYYFLDAETGVFQAVKGEVSPLTQQTFRPLQPTANPNEFWAAIKGDKFTEFGRYDSKLLKFKALVKLPEIEFESMQMFADEKEAKIYFVYEGHLLRIPLPK